VPANPQICATRAVTASTRQRFTCLAVSIGHASPGQVRGQPYCIRGSLRTDRLIVHFTILRTRRPACWLKFDRDGGAARVAAQHPEADSFERTPLRWSRLEILLSSG